MESTSARIGDLASAAPPTWVEPSLRLLESDGGQRLRYRRWVRPLSGHKLDRLAHGLTWPGGVARLKVQRRSSCPPPTSRRWKKSPCDAQKRGLPGSVVPGHAADCSSSQV